MRQSRARLNKKQNLPFTVPGKEVLDEEPVRHYTLVDNTCGGCRLVLQAVAALRLHNAILQASAGVVPGALILWENIKKATRRPRVLIPKQTSRDQLNKVRRSRALRRKRPSPQQTVRLQGRLLLR